MTLLSGLAAGFLVTISRQNVIEDLPLGVGLAAFGLCVLVSLFGILVSIRNVHPKRSLTFALWTLLASVVVFAFGVSAVMVKALSLPLWVIAAEAVAAGALFLVATRAKLLLADGAEPPPEREDLVKADEVK
jgi:hypothetical protein